MYSFVERRTKENINIVYDMKVENRK